MGSTFSSAAYADWLYDADTRSRVITLAELDRSESSAYNYYVVQFDSRTRDDSATADVRHILIGAASSGTTPHSGGVRRRRGRGPGPSGPVEGRGRHGGQLRRPGRPEHGRQRLPVHRRSVHRHLQHRQPGAQLPELGSGPPPASRGIPGSSKMRAVLSRAGTSCTLWAGTTPPGSTR